MSPECSLPASLAIPRTASVVGEVHLPGSKSITNRALLLAALARGVSRLHGVLLAEDSLVMIEALRKLGVACTHDPANQVMTVNGRAGTFGPCAQPLYVANAGTAARFLTACLNLGEGPYQIYGNPRMAERPMANLIDALAGLGCSIKAQENPGHLPLTIAGHGLPGGSVTLACDRSSQFLSAILLAAPYAHTPVHVHLEGSLVSQSYVDMTISMMADFGVTCEWLEANCLRVPARTTYEACNYVVEADASSASYFLAMAAITGGRISLPGLRRTALQGDLGLVEVLVAMGCVASWQGDSLTLEGSSRLRGVSVDMQTMSDVAPTLAVVALFADGVTRMHNLGHMRLKECDRLAALNRELTKLGARVEEGPASLSVHGLTAEERQRPCPSALDTYDDHRMAMALALAGLVIPEVVINNPGCVTKTFPDYFTKFFAVIGATL